MRILQSASIWSNGINQDYGRKNIGATRRDKGPDPQTPSLNEPQDIYTQPDDDSGFSAAGSDSKGEEATAAEDNAEGAITGKLGTSAFISDDTAVLTKRLVAAIGQFEVQQVLAKASTSLVNVKLAAAMGGDSAKAAQAIVRKLEKLISRCQRKISDLIKEDGLNREKIKLEQQKKQERAREIADELRKRVRERMNRERNYLNEQDNVQTNNDAAYNVAGSSAKLDAATESQISAQAQAMASAETSAGAESAGSTGDTSVSGGASDANAGDSGGMESAEAGGGGEAEA